MTKKRSIVKLCIVAVLTLIGLFLTFFSFVIPTTNTTFKGFFNAINYGYDINGGVLAVYEPSDNTITGYDLDSKLESTVSKLNSTLSSWGFNVTKQNNSIRVEISNGNYSEVKNKLLSTYNVDVLSLISSEKGIGFSGESSFDTAKTSDKFVGGEYIDSCKYYFQQNANAWVVDISFNEEGKTKFKELTQSILDNDKTTLYMFVNGQSQNFEIDRAVDTLTLTANDEQSAKALSMQISVLGKPLILTQVVNDTINGGLNTSTAGFFGNQSALLICALCFVLIATIVFMCVRYRVLGAMATMGIAIFIVLYAFLLQSIPLVLMDLNGVIGVLLTYIALVGGMVNIFEKIRSEYKMGKKIPNSVTSGFKKEVMPTLERYIFLLIICAVFFIVGTSALKAIAVNVFVGLFVNYFVLFVVLRGLCKIYLPINSTNKKLYNLKREAVKNEI